MTQRSTSLSAHPPLPRAFYLALLATTLFAMGLTMTFPLIPLFITDKLNAADRWIGTATLVVAMIAVTLRIPSGALSDRQGRRRMMLIGAGFGALSAAGYIVSLSLPVFLIARALSGVSVALFTTANKALIADIAPAIRRGEALGKLNASFSLAIVVSPLLGEGIKNAISFEAVFALTGLLSGLAFAVSYTLPRVKPQRETEASARRDIQRTVRERGIWSAMLMTGAIGTIIALMFTFFPVLAKRKDFFADAPGFISSVGIGLGLSIWAITDTTIEPVAGWLSDRFGRQPVALPGLAVTGVGLYLLSQASNTITAYGAVAVLATGWGTTRAAMDSISHDALPPNLRGMGAAVVYTCFDVAVGVGAQILGALIDGNDFSNFFLATAVAATGFGLLGLALATRLKTYEQRVATYPTPGD